MKRILLAMLLFATPVLAHERGYGDGYDTGYGDQHESGYGDDSSQSWDDSGYADRGPSFDDFRNDSELSWNGEWVDTPEYGAVWRPRRVGDDWQPYLYGRWVWTDAGWAWSSDEPFGWAVYHYGRWAYSPAMGWLWIPGQVWAPAWVSWRWTDGYAAWCPLGPRQVTYQPALWVVVPSRQFLEPVRHNVVPLHQRTTLPLPARMAPRAGPPIATVERATGRAVRPLVINDGVRPGATRPSSGSVTFYRPRTAPVAVPAREARPRWPGGAQVPPQRPQAVPRPVQQTPGAPRAVAPRAEPSSRPAPHASAPQASTGEHPQAKER